MKGRARAYALTPAGYRITDLILAGVVSTRAPGGSDPGLTEQDWASLAAAGVGLLRRHTSGLSYIHGKPNAVNVARLLRKRFIAMRREPVWSVTDEGRKALERRDRS